MDLASRLAKIVAATVAGRGCDCILLSGGVDTGFIAASLALEANARPRAYTVLPGPESPDAPHALEAAERLGLPLRVVRPTRAGWRSAFDLAAIALETADPVEVAGAAGAALGMAAAASDGCRCIVTGDGGDELFLGYTFLQGLPPEKLGEWRRRMASGGAFFSSKPIAGLLGLEACTPLYTPEARRLSLEAPVDCLLSGGWGKLLLRVYLDLAGLHGLAWRGKTPVTSGSGALEALEEASLGSEPLEGWEPSGPHAYLVRRLHASGLLPPPCEGPGRCPVCGRCLEPGGLRCRFCGAWLGGGRVSVYRGLRG